MLDLLSLKAVSKKYGIKQALNNINLNIPSEKIVGLFGPKGGGRTTLMKIITGVLNLAIFYLTDCIVTLCTRPPI